MFTLAFGAALSLKFGQWIISKIGDKGFDSVYSKLIEIDDKNQFYNTVKRTSDELEIKYPDILGGSINYFFQKEEVFNELINLLFVDANVSVDVISKHFDIETLPKDFISEFIISLRKNLLQSKEFKTILTNKEIYITCLGISNDLNLVKEQTTLSLTELTSIRKLLEDKFAKSFDEKEFKDNYLRNSLNNLSQVNIIGLGVDSEIRKGKRKKVNQIFVKPNFIIARESLLKLRKHVLLKARARRVISLSELFKIPGNMIILGNPGSGKSFVIKSIICSIINRSYSDFTETDIFGYLPFRIELRKYIIFKRAKGGNILNYLLFLLSTDYSINTVLEATLEDIISKEKTLFFFDGLDEIFNPIHKNEVKNDIENFHGNYKHARSITTSRIEGYEDAPFDKGDFYELTIEKFNNTQIEEYVNLWYKAEEDDNEIMNNEIQDFLSKKDTLDEELIRNPLLLSLIVILYRNNLKLPESKLEIYKSCTSTLVDKWDSSKELNIDLDIDILRRKETILADLAYWQYRELSDINGKKITYERAKNLVAKVIHEKLKIGDEYTVDSNAEQFMNYALKRSIYFDNTFTHKTFLEYYTAFWIYTNIEKKHKKNERHELIKEYIGNKFWHIVIELLINLIDKEQADDEIIDEIFLYQLENTENCLSFFLTVLPSIQNISLEVKRLLFSKSIEYLLTNAKNDKNKIENEFIKFSRFFILDEFKDILIQEFLKYEEIHISDSKELTYIYILLCESLLEVGKVGTEFYTEFELINKSKLIELSFKSEKLYKISSFLFREKELNNNWIEELYKYIQLFGLSQSFSLTPGVFRKSSYYPFLSYCLRNILSAENIFNIEDNLNRLYELGIPFEVLLVKFFSIVDYNGIIYKEMIQYLNDLLHKTLDIKTEILITSYLLLLKNQDFYIPEELEDFMHFDYDFNPNVKKILLTDDKRPILDILKREYELDNDKINNIRIGNL